MESEWVDDRYVNKTDIQNKHNTNFKTVLLVVVREGERVREFFRVKGEFMVAKTAQRSSSAGTAGGSAIVVGRGRAVKDHVVIVSAN